MSRILIIIGVLSILLFPNISKADCLAPEFITPVLYDMGYTVETIKEIPEGVLVIFTDGKGNYTFIHINNEAAVCVITFGKEAVKEKPA